MSRRAHRDGVGDVADLRDRSRDRRADEQHELVGGPGRGLITHSAPAGGPPASQVLALQARYGNRAVEQLLTTSPIADHGHLPGASRLVVQRTPDPVDPHATASRPSGVFNRLKRTLAGRLLAMWLEARGASTTVEDGRLVRQTLKQKVEKDLRSTQPRRPVRVGPDRRVPIRTSSGPVTPAPAGSRTPAQGAGAPPRVTATGPGGRAIKGGLRVLNVVGVVALAEQFRNIGEKRIPVDLDGLDPADFDVGHEFDSVYIGESTAGSVYVDIRVGTNIIRRRKFYIVNVHLGEA